jgi:hypothetical protein
MNSNFELFFVRAEQLSVLLWRQVQKLYPLYSSYMQLWSFSSETESLYAQVKSFIVKEKFF